MLDLQVLELPLDSVRAGLAVLPRMDVNARAAQI